MNLYHVLRRNALGDACVAEDVEADICLLRDGFFVFSVFLSDAHADVLQINADGVISVATEWEAGTEAGAKLSKVSKLSSDGRVKLKKVA